MKTIYRKNTDWLTVAEAKRLLIDALPTQDAVDFFVMPDGSIKVERNQEAKLGAPFVGADFIDACGKVGIEPRVTHRPTITDYKGAGFDDVIYSITHDEFVRYAALHGVSVEVESPAKVDQPAPDAEQTPPLEPGQAAPAHQVVQLEQLHAADQVEPAQAVSDWTLKEPKRGGGYRLPLYCFLLEAWNAGKPRPTARNVVEGWRLNKPGEIIQVNADGFSYYNSNGDIKAADLESVRKTIERMTDKRQMDGNADKRTVTPISGR